MNEHDLVHVDENDLEREWIEHPRAYHHHALLLAEARNKVAEAKAEFELVQAELDHKVRLHPDNYGLEKLTEKVVEAAVLRQPEYQVAQQVFLRARYDESVVQAAVDALDHKRTALSRLVELYLNDYNSQPRARGDAGRETGQVKADAAFGQRRRREDG